MTRALTLLTALLLVGCASGTEKLCSLSYDCLTSGDHPEELDESFVDTCIADYETSRAAADEAGCGTEYEAFLDCAVKNAECDLPDGEITGIYTTCDAEFQTYGACLSPGA